MSNFSVSLGQPCMSVMPPAKQAAPAQAAAPSASSAAPAQDSYVGGANLAPFVTAIAAATGNPPASVGALGADGVIANAASAIAALAGSVWNFVASHLFPGNPPLQKPFQPALPADTALPAGWQASEQAKFSAAFDQADVNKDGMLTGTELQNGVVNFDPANIGTVTRAEFIRQGMASDADARKASIDLANTPAKAARTIGALYQNTLGRAPTPQELTQALDFLGQGNTPDDLQASLQNSPEAQVRVAYKAVFGHDFIGTSRNWYMGQLAVLGGVDALKQQMLKDRTFYQQNHVGY